MRNLLALLGAVVVAFAVVGWYRGWYSVQSETDRGGRESVNIEISRERISEDLHKGGERIHEALEKGHSPKKEEPFKHAEAAVKDALKPGGK
jgi:hypothetical protein